MALIYCSEFVTLPKVTPTISLTLIKGLPNWQTFFYTHLQHIAQNSLNDPRLLEFVPSKAKAALMGRLLHIPSSLS